PGSVSVSVRLFAGYAAEEGLEIACLRYRGMHRMIGRLPAGLEDLDEVAGVPRGRLNGGHEVLRRKVVRAGAGHEQPLAVDQREGELVELAVCGLPLRDVLFALDERRRIEHYHVEALACCRERLHGVERVRAHRLQRYSVARGIALRVAQ